MLVARKPKMYNSHKVFSDYIQMRGNLHLFLLKKGLIVNMENAEEISLDWNKEKRFLYVKTTHRNVLKVDAEEFEQFVERGLVL